MPPLPTFSPILRFNRFEPITKDAREISKVILILLAAGVVITSALVAPNATGPIAKLILHWKTDHWRRRRVVHRLRRLHYVRIKIIDGQPHLTLTQSGRDAAAKFGVGLIQIKRPVRWDKKWRIVVFDIPERHRVARDILRVKLKQLGFRRIQQSVWVLPWPCRPEIEYLRELYSLDQYLTFWEVRDGPDFSTIRETFFVRKL